MALLRNGANRYQFRMKQENQLKISHNRQDGIIVNLLTGKRLDETYTKRVTVKFLAADNLKYCH